MAGRILDWVLALGGGLIDYALLYFLGFVILRNNLAILWYILMIFSIREVGFRSMAMTTAIIAAGLAPVVNPPQTAAGPQSAPADPEKPSEAVA
jgi:ABC-type multidrug transport system permease subunit